MRPTTRTGWRLCVAWPLLLAACDAPPSPLPDPVVETSALASAAVLTAVEAGPAKQGLSALGKTPLPMVRIAEILKAFHADRDAARAAFQGKDLRVSGPLYRGIPQMSGPDLLYIGSYETGFARCYIPWADPALERAKGEIFTLEGRVFDVHNSESMPALDHPTPTVDMSYCRVVSPMVEGTTWDPK